MTTSSKRSRKAALRLMVPAGLALLAGCEQPTMQAAVFESAEQCAQQLDKEQCEADFKKAQEMHEKVAPRYQTLAQCEADFGQGQCQAPQPVSQAQPSSGSGFFMPMMMGYLAGKMFNNNNSNFTAQLLYRAKDDPSTFRTGANQPIARQTGLVGVTPNQLQTYSNNQIRRGGFGAQAQRRQEQHTSSSSYGG